METAQSLTTRKLNELDVKQLLTQQVDFIALLGYITHELACLRRYIKSNGFWNRNILRYILMMVPKVNTYFEMIYPKG